MFPLALTGSSGFVTMRGCGALAGRAAALLAPRPALCQTARVALTKLAEHWKSSELAWLETLPPRGTESQRCASMAPDS